jgi:uncharacterized membrane protein
MNLPMPGIRQFLVQLFGLLLSIACSIAALAGIAGGIMYLFKAIF